MRPPVLLLVSLLATFAPGCRPPPVEPPYTAGAAPSSASLLATLAPKLTALQVPAAKVRVGRAPAANLMFLAQQPGRFSGQIQVAGHEFLSLAFHEQGYTLRNVAAGNLPEGFFHGPPADCAIQRLLGVPFAAHELVALVLGGAPLIRPPYEVIDQHWDPRHGHEVLRLRASTYEQELRFAFVAGAWWPAGSTLWRRDPQGSLSRMWSLLHEDLHPVSGTVLPQRTRIVGASERKQERVVITYNTQLLNPDLGDRSEPTSDSGDDDSGWEDEDSGAPSDPAEPTTPSPAMGSPSEPADQPAKPPAHFVLDAAGLTPRGDLCR